MALESPVAGSHQVWIAYGSNQENPIAQLLTARTTLAAHPQLRESAVSPLYRTPPWGDENQPDFYNAVVRYATTLGAQELLTILQQTENAHHRVRTHKNGPRTLDLDILLFDDARIDSATLTVPHPRMHERAFVLQPLADIDSDKSVGDYGSVAALLARLDCRGQSRVAAADWQIGNRPENG